ncbi:BREX-1 system adenine-specific DNA-methyltransferase PglX [Rhodococcus sp. 66b]|uniref:BREX-1 system adenine-specific DNA-methyltransferase PglX n=1 Tax=Rhodococcus sp. 66b TaxID=1945511 RepID=UPI0009BC29EA|nr:BREX-1 system adenine-specific DNA-methyltransferase PglX [Rhodococcus sp. 66b]OQM82711.1 hypothetical protein B0E55_01436 [Rhodococcus sp. 66b]
MDTKPLESFAKAARRELIVAVEARVSTVLAAGSVARSERSETVRLLESVIADHGRAHVIDRVAYTWFNRLIALRFMDARGYTAAGVVSPASGHAHGQPEIMADAKRGDVDTEVVTNVGAHEAIMGLLDGTRRSTDAEGEAYALLLTEYCRHWHKTMPFMFEAEGAYTELLVPAGLLADGALLSRAREVLTEDVCDDVEVIGWLYQFYISERKVEVFAGFKKNKKAGADEIPAATQLFTPHWIVRYLLENSLGRLWMLNRPASRLVDQMDYYIAPVDKETDFLKVSGPEELTVIDPACGSGHMLTYAFDLLYSIYEEEGYAPLEIPSLILTHNIHGTEIDPRAGALAAFALTMKARAKDRRYFMRSGAQPKICVIEPISFAPDELDLFVTKNGDSDAEEAFWNQFRDADTLGSLIQSDADATKEAGAVLAGLNDLEGTLYYDTLVRARKAVTQADVLSRKYSVVTANPPYGGLGNLAGSLASWARKTYPVTKTDLYSMFIERSLLLVVPHGLVAMVTMQSWMSLRYFEGLRAEILEEQHLVSMAHFGTRAFDSIGGEVVGTTAFVIARQVSSRASRASFMRLVAGRSEAVKAQKLREIAAGDTTDHYVLELAHLTRVPGKAFVYWATNRDFELFETFEAVGDHVETRVGLITGDNDSFLRRWHEVSLGGIEFEARQDALSRCRWFPYVKGGEYRRWAGNYEFVVNWYNDGTEVKSNVDLETGRMRAHNFNGEFAFREGFTWSGISSNGFAVRDVPTGFMFDTKGPMGFPVKPTELRQLQGLLNSAVAVHFMRMLAPTLDFNLGHVMSIPFSTALPAEFASWAEECVSLAWRDWDLRETAWGFKQSPLVSLDAQGRIEDYLDLHVQACQTAVSRMRKLEMALNQCALKAYGLADLPDSSVLNYEITLDAAGVDEPGFARSAVGDLISYAVGCIFGRYSLDESGLILADQGATLQDYLAKVSNGSIIDVTFIPDADNVIPFVDDGWFEDDIVERFRQFLKAAFGTEHFEENLRFVEESLGVKMLRDYFITKSGKSKFYDDHIKRYKKRPIYWMFSSPKGSFNALIYLHRYTPSTVSTVLNEYLREYENKLQKAFERAETAAAGGTSAKDQKEADRLRKVLAELRDYEHDVLYPLATQQVEIDLDDGVKVNYPKFYPAVKKIVGLEASDG